MQRMKAETRKPKKKTNLLETQDRISKWCCLKRAIDSLRLMWSILRIIHCNNAEQSPSTALSSKVKNIFLPRARQRTTNSIGVTIPSAQPAKVGLDT